MKPLSAREGEVLQLICDGLADKEIGRTLGLQRGTVRCHVASILKKLGAKNRTHAAVMHVRQEKS